MFSSGGTRRVHAVEVEVAHVEILPAPGRAVCGRGRCASSGGVVVHQRGARACQLEQAIGGFDVMWVVGAASAVAVVASATLWASIAAAQSMVWPTPLQQRTTSSVQLDFQIANRLDGEPSSAALSLPLSIHGRLWVRTGGWFRRWPGGQCPHQWRPG